MFLDMLGLGSIVAAVPRAPDSPLASVNPANSTTPSAGVRDADVLVNPVTPSSIDPVSPSHVTPRTEPAASGPNSPAAIAAACELIELNKASPAKLTPKAEELRQKAEIILRLTEEKAAGAMQITQLTAKVHQMTALLGNSTDIETTARENLEAEIAGISDRLSALLSVVKNPLFQGSPRGDLRAAAGSS